MAELFGFTITRKKEQGASFTLPTPDDGAVDIAQGGFFSSVYDKSQHLLLKRYQKFRNQKVQS